MTASGFEEWLVSAAPRLHRSAFLLTGDWALAEDLVQVTSAVVWARFGRIDAPDAYAKQVMVRKVASWRRRRWTAEVPTAALPDPLGDRWSEVDCRAALAAGLAQLTQRQRAVLFLRYYEDLSEAETAAFLNWPIGTVKSTTARALAGLRQLDELVEYR